MVILTQMTVAGFQESSGVRETPAARAESSLGSFMPTPDAAFSGGSLSSGSNSIRRSVVVNNKTFEAVKAERDKLCSDLNKLKQKHIKTKVDLSYKTVQLRALIATVDSYEKKLRKLKADMIGLRQLLEQRTENEELLKRKRRVSILDDLDMRSVDIGSEIMLRMHIYCGREICELNPFADEKSRRWKLRSEAVEHRGVQTRNRTMIAPFPPNALACKARYITSSSDINKSFLR